MQVVILNKLRDLDVLDTLKYQSLILSFPERAIKAVLVGYKSNGYLLWHPSTGKFVESRNVRFNEKLVYKDVYKNKAEDKRDMQVLNNEEKIDWNWMKDLKENEEEKKEKEIREPKTIYLEKRW